MHLKKKMIYLKDIRKEGTAHYLLLRKFVLARKDKTNIWKWKWSQWWISWLKLSLFIPFNNTVSMVSQINYFFDASMIIEWKLHVTFSSSLSIMHFIKKYIKEKCEAATLLGIQLLMDHTHFSDPSKREREKWILMHAGFCVNIERTDLGWQIWI